MSEKKLSYRITFILLITGLILLTGFIAANSTQADEIIPEEEIMPLNDIEPGMDGTGLTVFSGVEVDEFDFEVVDVLPDYQQGQDLILVYLSGENIEEAGGVASGMSGSPLYVDDRIMGAISYGWAESDSRYALATPIEPMLELLAEEETDPGTGMEELPEIKTPLITAGLSGRSQERLETELDEFFMTNFEVVPGSDEPRMEPDEYPELEPGSAISVKLARGDVTIASIGTMTYRQDDEILAMGHPFTHRGNVDFFLGQAHISSIIPGDMPFKLGSPLPQPIGRIEQDRLAGISGGIDHYPDIIPLNIEVEDEDREVTDSIDVQIIDDEDLLMSLPGLISLETLDSTLDRIGRGTAETTVRVMANELQEVVLRRDNMFYSQQDIAARSLEDLQVIMDIISNNPFQDAGLFDIEYSVTVREEDQVALLQEAEIKEEEAEIKPGDELDISIMLRPYRQEKKELEYTIELPDDINPGPASLSLSGGPTRDYGPVGTDEFDDEDLSASVEGFTDLEPMLLEFVELPQYNDLVMEVYPGYPGIPHWEEEEEVEEEPDPEERPDPDEDEEPEEEPEPEEITPEEVDEEERIREVESTDYVLEGELHIDFTISDDNSREVEDDELPEEDDENGESR